MVTTRSAEKLKRQSLLAGIEASPGPRPDWDQDTQHHVDGRSANKHVVDGEVDDVKSASVGNSTANRNGFGDAIELKLPPCPTSTSTSRPLPDVISDATPTILAASRAKRTSRLNRTTGSLVTSPALDLTQHDSASPVVLETSNLSTPTPTSRTRTATEPGSHDSARKRLRKADDAGDGVTAGVETSKADGDGLGVAQDNEARLFSGAGSRKRIRVRVLGRDPNQGSSSRDRDDRGGTIEQSGLSTAATTTTEIRKSRGSTEAASPERSEPYKSGTGTTIPNRSEDPNLSTEIQDSEDDLSWSDQHEHSEDPKSNSSGRKTNRVVVREGETDTGVVNPPPYSTSTKNIEVKIDRVPTADVCTCTDLTRSTSRAVDAGFPRTSSIGRTTSEGIVKKETQSMTTDTSPELGTQNEATATFSRHQTFDERFSHAVVSDHAGVDALPQQTGELGDGRIRGNKSSTNLPLTVDSSKTPEIGALVKDQEKNKDDTDETEVPEIEDIKLSIPRSGSRTRAKTRNRNRNSIPGERASPSTHTSPTSAHVSSTTTATTTLVERTKHRTSQSWSPLRLRSSLNVRANDVVLVPTLESLHISTPDALKSPRTLDNGHLRSTRMVAASAPAATDRDDDDDPKPVGNLSSNVSKDTDTNAQTSLRSPSAGTKTSATKNHISDSHDPFLPPFLSVRQHPNHLNVRDASHTTNIQFRHTSPSSFQVQRPTNLPRSGVVNPIPQPSRLPPKCTSSKSRHRNQVFQARLDKNGTALRTGSGHSEWKKAETKSKSRSKLKSSAKTKIKEDRPSINSTTRTGTGTGTKGEFRLQRSWGADKNPFLVP